MKTYVSALAHYNLENERVILRADLNVPINQSGIADDYRLQAILPTMDLILKKGGSITLLTHIGRPKNQESSLSTKILLPWFKQRNYEITWAKDILHAQNLIKPASNRIVLLENLRFFPGEKNHDKHFAQSLSLLGEYFVNDAFGALHREDSSITLLPEFFIPEHRTIGLLVEKELKMLSRLVQKPRKPFVLVLGGGKVRDKLPVIANLLDHAQSILLCPAIVNTFIKAQGYETGKSLIDESALDLCRDIIEKAKKKNVQIYFPQDYLIVRESLEGSLETVVAEQVPHNGIIISLGDKTIKLYGDIIHNAGTIFFNAAMGFVKIENSLQATQALLRAVAKSEAFSVVGGGDSVAAAQKAGICDSIDFLSTGGGATLAYLSGAPLPGLFALYSKN
jgi:phosphoglycerate kinase